mgnify:CR=1 FL=1
MAPNPVFFLMIRRPPRSTPFPNTPLFRSPICPHCGALQTGGQPAAAVTGSKSKVTAGVLALLLGGLGIHKFYLGAWGWGIVYILLVWTLVPGIVALVEAIRYFVLSEADFQRKAAQMRGPFAFLW